MPRQKPFDKRTATTFQLVHRAQNDPLAQDDTAPQMVFAEKKSTRRPTEDDYAYSSAGSVVSGTSSYRSTKTKQRADLEGDFHEAYRPNEGEAAQHGVFYDDTQYDYMQHMRDLGSGQGNVTWVDGTKVQDLKKAKGKMKLEDALRDMEIAGENRSIGGDSVASSARSLLPEEVLPSDFVRKRTYQDQQDVPDEIAGFQPDMDPRLREVLEALEDEAYVDDEEDIFGQLTQDGFEVEREEWDMLGEQQVFEDGDEDAGWESDDTIKAAGSPRVESVLLQLPKGMDVKPPEDVQAQPPADPTAGAWLDEFEKFKSAAKGVPNGDHAAAAVAPSTLQSSALSSLASGRRKKRKGAKTSTTDYSMTSSALARTDQQTLLDARFDKIEESYLEDEMADDEFNESMSTTSGMTGMSKASHASRYSNMSGLSGVSGMSGVSSYSRASDAEGPQLERSDFNSVMDEFLGNYSTTGKAGRRVKRGGPQSGMEQLDEVRAQLGPARFRTKTKSK